MTTGDDSRNANSFDNGPTVATSTAVVSYLLSRTALRWGAKRLAGVFMGGAAFSILTAGYFLFQMATTTPSTLRTMEEVELLENDQGEEVEYMADGCEICHEASELTCSGASSHSFCLSCFNRFVQLGLSKPDGYFFQEEASPNGQYRRRMGEIPCPMFCNGCDCHSISADSLALCLTQENMMEYQRAKKWLVDSTNEDESQHEYNTSGLRHRHPVMEQ